MTYFNLLVLLNVVVSNKQENVQLIEQAVNVTNKYYNYERVTSVVWSDDDTEAVTYFLRKFTGPVLLTPLLSYNNSMILDMIQHFIYLQTVFFATESEEFEYFMNIIRKNSRFPIRLVLILKKPVLEHSVLLTYNAIAWQNNLADIIIIYKNKTDNKVNLSTYFPYSNDFCGNYKPIFLDPNENLFPNKFSNLNKCVVRVSARQHVPLVDLTVVNGTVTSFKGYDASVLKIIMEVLNATYEVYELATYGHSRNGTPTGGFNDLVNNRTDLITPSGILNFDRYAITLTSHGYNDARIRWIGPKRRVRYRWIKLIIPFLNNVTPFLCLTFFLFIMVAILIRRYTLSRREYEGSSLCFRAFSLLVGQVVKFMTRVPLLNNIFLLWIWFCFILRIVYQGFLVNFLHKTLFEPPFQGLKEAVTEVEGYGGLTVFLDYYRDTPLGKDFMVMPRPLYFTYLNRTIHGERFLLVSDSYLFYRFRRSIQILDEPVSGSLSCLYMRPGWPVAETIDSIIVRLLEAGITQKFLNLKDDKRRNTKGIRKKVYSLSIAVVGSCFFLMSFMWLVCSITLLIEVVYYKYTHPTKRR